MLEYEKEWKKEDDKSHFFIDLFLDSFIHHQEHKHFGHHQEHKRRFFWIPMFSYRLTLYIARLQLHSQQTDKTNCLTCFAHACMEVGWVSTLLHQLWLHMMRTTALIGKLDLPYRHLSVSIFLCSEMHIGRPCKHSTIIFRGILSLDSAGEPDSRAYLVLQLHQIL